MQLHDEARRGDHAPVCATGAQHAGVRRRARGHDHTGRVILGVCMHHGSDPLPGGEPVSVLRQRPHSPRLPVTEIGGRPLNTAGPSRQPRQCQSRKTGPRAGFLIKSQTLQRAGRSARPCRCPAATPAQNPTVIGAAVCGAARYWVYGPKLARVRADCFFFLNDPWWQYPDNQTRRSCSLAGDRLTQSAGTSDQSARRGPVHVGAGNRRIRRPR